jgi:hypothetical protein
MSEITVYRACDKCGGDGEWPNADTSFNGNPVEPEEVGECAKCAGEGKLYAGSFELSPGLDDIMDKCNDIFDIVSQ